MADERDVYRDHLVAAGVHAKAIANQLGHSTIAITMDRYGHLFPDQDAAVAGGMEDTFRQAAVVGSSRTASVGGC